MHLCDFSLFVPQSQAKTLGLLKNFTVFFTVMGILYPNFLFTISMSSSCPLGQQMILSNVLRCPNPCGEFIN